MKRVSICSEFMQLSVNNLCLYSRLTPYLAFQAPTNLFSGPEAWNNPPVLELPILDLKNNKTIGMLNLVR